RPRSGDGEEPGRPARARPPRCSPAGLQLAPARPGRRRGGRGRRRPGLGARARADNRSAGAAPLHGALQARRLAIGSAAVQTLRRTPLYERHAALGARLVPFAGWEMPVQYTSIVGEHRAVRTSAGVFDVSHMGQLQISGDGAHDDMQARLANDRGGIVDDLIAYRRGTDAYFLVVNASNVEPDHAALSETEDVSAEWAL